MKYCVWVYEHPMDQIVDPLAVEADSELDARGIAESYGYYVDSVEPWDEKSEEY